MSHPRPNALPVADSLETPVIRAATAARPTKRTFMDLNYVHRLMVGAAGRSTPGVRVTDARGCKEINQMAAAGLIEMSSHGSRLRPVVAIERLTDLGRCFHPGFPRGSACSGSGLDARAAPVGGTIIRRSAAMTAPEA